MSLKGYLLKGSLVVANRLLLGPGLVSGRLRDRRGRLERAFGEKY